MRSAYVVVGGDGVEAIVDEDDLLGATWRAAANQAFAPPPPHLQRKNNRVDVAGAQAVTVYWLDGRGGLITQTFQNPRLATVVGPLFIEGKQPDGAFRFNAEPHAGDTGTFQVAIDGQSIARPIVIVDVYGGTMQYSLNRPNMNVALTPVSKATPRSRWASLLSRALR